MFYAFLITLPWASMIAVDHLPISQYGLNNSHTHTQNNSGMEGCHLSTTVAEARLKQLQSDDPIAWQERCSKCSWLVGESGDVGCLIFRRQAKHVFAFACYGHLSWLMEALGIWYINVFVSLTRSYSCSMYVVADCIALHTVLGAETALWCGWSPLAGCSKHLKGIGRSSEGGTSTTAKTRLLRDSSGPALS